MRLRADLLESLPLTTLPLPAISTDTAGRLRALSTAEIQAIDHGKAPASVADGARWAVWGAARTGARTTLTTAQKRGLLVAGAFGALLMALAPHTLVVWLLFFVTLLYVITSAYKGWLMAQGERATTAGKGMAPDLTALCDDELPLYSILVPVHREREMLPVLLDRLQAFNYPAEKLEILLLIESDDDETRAALLACELPAHMRPITVPPGEPKTKPRALNVGLARARGEYIVVYDAEDQPEPDQLRMAVAAFRASSRQVICYQARLGFYNPQQSTLTRLFTLDYYVWYDLMLQGLARARGLVPLGGTSNHFRASALRQLGGWDPYNVTEDGDLGVRIARAGLKARMLDSVTWEEAVAQVKPWIRQRSRWIKGYMQTYLVHMREPWALWRQLGPSGFVDFQALLGGSSLILLVNPLMWLLTLAYFLGHGTVVDIVIQSFFPAPVYYLALLCLVGGNFVFFYTNVYACVRAGYYELARYMLLGPLYWLLMSVAAWVALASLIRNPHYWAKTQHGVSLGLGNLSQSVVTVGSGSSAFASAVAVRPLAPSRAMTWSPSHAGMDDKRVDLPWRVKSLSIILPAYNEEALIASTVRSVVKTLASWDLEFEVVVVNDGSRDRTSEIIESLAASDRRIRAITHPVNQGYGAALVTGFESADNDLVFFMDSDGQFDISDLADFLPLIEQYDTVWGYRRNRKDTRMRRLNAWGWKQLVHLFLGVSVRDVDCAFKLFRAEFFRTYQLETGGAMINAEMLYKLHRGGYNIAQVGVCHIERKAGRATGAKPAVISRAIRDLVVCTWRWRIKGHA